MSDHLPPTGPPSGPPPSGPPSGPSWGPPSGPPPPPPAPWQDGSAEVLQSGQGGPVPPGRRSSGSGGRRGALVAGGALAGVAVLAAGAWAGYSMLFATGPQPAEALPDTTVGYVSVDLDPSGRQKLEALETLQKFPAFAENVDIETDEDLRARLFSEIQGDGTCEGVDFDDDIEPWLGDRFAAAAIDTGDAEASGGLGITAVGVVQLDDAAAAEEGLQALSSCGGSGEEFGWSIAGDWAVVAETTEIAEQVTDAAAEAPLSGDDDFQDWTGEAGDPGIVTAYLAPAAGPLLADAVGGLGAFGGLGGLGLTDPADPLCLPSPGDDPFGEDPFGDDSAGEDVPTPPCDDVLDPSTGEVPDEVTSMFEDFEGGAMTVRFEDGGVEVEAASGSAQQPDADTFSDAGAEVVSTLPSDTAIALGFGLEAGWFDAVRASVDDSLGEGGLDGFLEIAEGATGLELPEDIETLLGESTAIALGGDADLMGFTESAPPTDLELGLKVQGDGDEITGVLERLLGGSDDPTLGTLLDFDADGDVVVAGPSSDYREALLDDGGLGSSDAYRDAVVDADDANAVLFVNFDAGSWLESVPDVDEEILANLRPLSALGVSSRLDDGVNHVAVRLTTE